MGFPSVASHSRRKKLYTGIFRQVCKLIRLPRRFKRSVYAMDSTRIKLFANCMDWVKHRSLFLEIASVDIMQGSAKTTQSPQHSIGIVW